MIRMRRRTLAMVLGSIVVLALIVIAVPMRRTPQGPYLSALSDAVVGPAMAQECGWTKCQSTQSCIELSFQENTYCAWVPQKGGGVACHTNNCE